MFDSIIILGPTATGKTGLSISLAKKLNAEIVNADSMYIYKDLNIGTAKPTENEMDNITHHLISFVEPNEEYSVAQYVTDATKVINEIWSKKKFPIIVGGTGFYIDSLIKNYTYGDSNKDKNIRDNLNKLLEEKGKEFLYDYLKSLDLETANKLHFNDTKRVIRAIEVILQSGHNNLASSNTREAILKSPLIIGLNIPRDILYDRINKRVDVMLEQGLVDEVKSLFNRGLIPENNQCMKGIGYKELISFFREEIEFDRAIDLIKQHSRNYAKRQITWFKRNESIHWFNPLSEDNLANKIIDMLK